MVTIDGSKGEGGGQIIRSALALSLITGIPVRIDHVRAKRSRPGLLRQHLTAVTAAAEIGQARVEGAALGSSRLTFTPGQISAGTHSFNIGSAGSTMLVLQTILPVLMLADEPSHVTLEGGTHNSHSPPFDYMQKVYTPLLGRMGVDVAMQLVRHGFYPAGGGQVTVSITPARNWKPLELHARGELLGIHVSALIARLPLHIAERECHRVRECLPFEISTCDIVEAQDSHGPGNAVLIEVPSQHTTELFTSFGQKGKPAERVAEEVADETRRYLESDVPVGEHLADQLLLPLCLSAAHGGGGSYRTFALSSHATTQIDLLKRFLNTNIAIHEESSGDVRVSIGD